MTNPGFALMPFMTTVIAAIGLGVALYLLFNDDRNEHYEPSQISRTNNPRSTWPNNSERNGTRHRTSVSGSTNDMGQQCSICYDVNKKEEFYKTKCAHYFHSKCLQTWQRTGEGRNTCPICRAMINLIT